MDRSDFTFNFSRGNKQGLTPHCAFASSETSTSPFCQHHNITQPPPSCLVPRHPTQHVSKLSFCEANFLHIFSNSHPLESPPTDPMSSPPTLRCPAKKAAACLHRDAAAIHYAVRGGSFHFQRFMDLSGPPTCHIPPSVAPLWDCCGLLFFGTKPPPFPPEYFRAFLGI